MNREDIKRAMLQRIKFATRYGLFTRVNELRHINGFHLNGSTVRKMVRELVQEGHPISSSRKGYRFILTSKEMQQYLNRMQKVQVALSERIADAYHAYNKTWGDK